MNHLFDFPWIFYVLQFQNRRGFIGALQQDTAYPENALSQSDLHADVPHTVEQDLKLQGNTQYDALEEYFADFKTEAQTDFDTWFEGLQDVLDENTAGNLLNMITALTARVDPAVFCIQRNRRMAYFSGGSDFAGRSCYDTGRANRNLCRVIVWTGMGNTQLYAGYFDRSGCAPP